jgi:hypothetical protein
VPRATRQRPLAIAIVIMSIAAADVPPPRRARRARSCKLTAARRAGHCTTSGIPAEAMNIARIGDPESSRSARSLATWGGAQARRPRQPQRLRCRLAAGRAPGRGTRERAQQRRKLPARATAGKRGVTVRCAAGNVPNLPYPAHPAQSTSRIAASPIAAAANLAGVLLVELDRELHAAHPPAARCRSPPRPRFLVEAITPQPARHRSQPPGVRRTHGCVSHLLWSRRLRI